MKIIDDIIIIVILITLLAIKIVANNNSGLPINDIITLCWCSSDSFKLFLSEGVKEKNAISEPEIIPEQISKNTHDKRGSKKLIISVLKTTVC